MMFFFVFLIMDYHTLSTFSSSALRFITLSTKLRNSWVGKCNSKKCEWMQKEKKKKSNEISLIFQLFFIDSNDMTWRVWRHPLFQHTPLAICTFGKMVANSNEFVWSHFWDHLLTPHWWSGLEVFSHEIEFDFSSK